MKRFLTLAACVCALQAARTTAQTVVTPSGVIPAVISAQEVTRIEEDWFAYIVNPDTVVGSPQLVNILSPDGTLKGAYGLFEFNHGTGPEFFSGGVQTQAWKSKSLIDLSNSQHHGVLTKEREQLSYTLRMEIKDGHLEYGISNGSSTSWGEFAKSTENLSARQPTSLTRFRNYSPEHSVAQSFVNHGAHRVLISMQRKVRYYRGDALIAEDTTPRISHRYQQEVQYISLDEYEAKFEEYNTTAKTTY